ncbi:MAG: FAD-dependent oxidoreductase, partial [Actinobacteria bacterium]|nr:FAD-dependent oxidoreductase [Actinomycetota bacterium]
MAGSEARSSRYDVVVVGAGPAGISAAINVANRKRTVVVMDGQPPFAKTRTAHSIPNYPGFTYASGEELAEAFVAHLEEFDVPHLKEKVSRIMRDDDGFLVFTDRDVYHAGAIVLATGVYREAELEGEEELVGQGVSYCVTCDGRLFAGREVAFISYSADGEDEASVLAEDYATTVTYLPLYAGDYHLPDGVRVLPRVRPERLSREDGKVHVRLPDEELAVDAVFVYKHSVSPRTLLDGLTSDGRHVTVDRRLETGIPGVFAAGDCTGEPYQIAKAVGEGQVAALHAIQFLRDRTRPAEEEPPALKPEDRDALGRILRERMRDPVRLLHFTQLSGDGRIATPCRECREARRLVTEFAGLSPMLLLEVHDFMEATPLAKELGVARVPATLVS